MKPHHRGPSLVGRLAPAVIVVVLVTLYLSFVVSSLHGNGDSLETLVRKHRRGHYGSDDGGSDTLPSRRRAKHGSDEDDEDIDARPRHTRHTRNTRDTQDRPRHLRQAALREEAESSEGDGDEGGDPDTHAPARHRLARHRQAEESDTEGSEEAAEDGERDPHAGKRGSRKARVDADGDASGDAEEEAGEGGGDGSGGGARKRSSHKGGGGEGARAGRARGAEGTDDEGSSSGGGEEDAVNRLLQMYSDVDLSELPEGEAQFYDEGEYRKYWADPQVQKAKELLQRYTVFHNTKVQEGSVQGAIVVTPVGQLCNRLMTITSGFVLALLTKKVLLVDDSQFYCSMNDLFDQPGFRWLRHQAGVNVATQATIMNPDHPPWPHTEKLLCQDLSRAYPGNVLLRMNQYIVPFLAWNPHYRSALQGVFSNTQLHRFSHGYTAYDDLDIFTPVARFLFRPTKDLLSKKHQFMKNHFKGKRVVGMQVRSGNDFTQNFMKPKDWHLYEKCGEDDAAEDQDAVYFVATDTAEGREAAEKNLKNGEVVFGPGPFLRSNNPKGVQMALLDVLLLAEADALITTAWSSFGYMAAGLRGKPKVIVSDFKKGGDKPVPQDVEQFFMGVPHKSDKRVICAKPPSHQPCFHKFANWGSREASCFDPEMIQKEMLSNRYC